MLNFDGLGEIPSNLQHLQLSQALQPQLAIHQLKLLRPLLLGETKIVIVTATGTETGTAIGTATVTATATATVVHVPALVLGGGTETGTEIVAAGVAIVAEAVRPGGARAVPPLLRRRNARRATGTLLPTPLLRLESL